MPKRVVFNRKLNYIWFPLYSRECVVPLHYSKTNFDQIYFLLIFQNSFKQLKPNKKPDFVNFFCIQFFLLSTLKLFGHYAVHFYRIIFPSCHNTLGAGINFYYCFFNKSLQICPAWNCHFHEIYIPKCTCIQLYFVTFLGNFEWIGR